MKENKDYIITSHAKEQIEIRGISKELLKKVMDNPDQILTMDINKRIYQSITSQ